MSHPYAVLAALHLYAATTCLDFGDSLIVASMQERGSSAVYSYDADLDRIPGISRQAP